MREMRLTCLIIFLIAISTGSVFATDIDNIKDLWEIRDNLGGDYTLTVGLDLEDTIPDTIMDWVTSTSYATGDIIENPTDGYAYYCDTPNSDATFITGKWTKMWLVSKGWQPIGTEATPFHGNFDGGGKIISNLYINRGADYFDINTLIDTLATIPANGENYVGLFGYVTNGSSASNGDNSADIYIKNVGMTNVNITGKRGTGALIGKVLLPDKKKKKKVYTENCYATGTVSGFGATGGLVGANNSDVKQTVPVIRYCYANVTVSSTNPLNVTINTGDNNNPYNIKYGGLVGCNENGVTQDSYATGNVSGGDRVGGLAGCTIGGAIFRCYATGDVTQGISSLLWEGGYGPITGKTEGKLPPGLGGTNATGSIEDSYYLSNATVAGTTDGNTYGTPQTSVELIAAEAYSNWDSNVWDFTTNYPTLGDAPASIFYFKSKNTSGSFSTATNWENSETLDGTYATSVLKPDYTNSYSIEVISGNTITLNTGKSAFISTTTVNGKLIVDTGATLNIENKTGEDLIVNGELEIKGTLNIGASATVSIDELISPTSMYLSWAGNSRNVICSAIATDTTASLYPEYIKRSWNLIAAIDDATETNRSKNITFYWTTADDNNYDWGAAIPILHDGTTETTGTSVLLDGDIRSATFTYTFPQYNELLDSNIEFRIGLGDNQTLPVQLSTFDAFNQLGNTVMVQWITQSESNLDGYRLFRNNNNSLDTSVMLDVFISGTNTSQSQTYSHLDETITEDGIYYYWIQMIDYDGTNSFYGPAILQVDDDFNNSVDVPYKTGFVSIYPNPFNPTTSFRYYLESNSKVEIQVYNIKGQVVKSFNLGNETKGFHSVVWNGKNNNNNNLPSGVYFTKMKTNDRTDLKKIILMK